MPFFFARMAPAMPCKNPSRPYSDLRQREHGTAKARLEKRARDLSQQLHDHRRPPDKAPCNEPHERERQRSHDAVAYPPTVGTDGGRCRDDRTGPKNLHQPDNAMRSCWWILTHAKIAFTANQACASNPPCTLAANALGPGSLPPWGSTNVTCLLPTPAAAAENVAIGKHNPGARFVIVAYLWQFLSDNVNCAGKTVAFLTKA